MQLRLELNGQPFVTGVSSFSLTVLRYGSALVEIDAISNLAGLARQLKGIASGQGEAVCYKLIGKVTSRAHPWTPLCAGR